MNLDPNVDGLSSIAQSLSGSDTAIVKHLSYVLQDLWELGCGTKQLTELIDKNLIKEISEYSVLDLCCGKGALLVTMALRYGCRGTGIDLFVPFIEEAKKIASRENLENKVVFELMDIRDAVRNFTDFDLVIYGSDVFVLGSEEETLMKIKNCCKPNGYLLFETVSSDMEMTNRTITSAGFRIIDITETSKEYLRQSNNFNNEKIRKRAAELIKKYPHDKLLLEDYVKAQQKESDELENEMLLLNYLLQRIN